MRIIIVVIGSWGDIRPNVVLGQALQNEGYEVLVVSIENFRQWVQSRGLAFAALSIDAQSIIDKIAYSSNPLVMMDSINRLLNPALLQVSKEISAVVREGDALLVIAAVVGLVNGIVEKYRLRLILLNLQPFTPSREIAAMGMPTLPKWLPLRGWLNYRLGYIGYRLAWVLFGSLGNELRTKHLGLPKQSWARHRLMLDTTPTITAVSPHVLPETADWKPHQRLTGYLFDEDNEWQAPQALLDFLEEGAQPIYVGFGSMGDRDADATSRLVLQGIRLSGKRAVLLSGWAGLGNMTMPKEVFLLRYAPHSWLFPGMAAVVHHGGAGTVAAGLAAGVPSVIVPFFGDQPAWAQIVYELGAGTKPLPRSKLTADNLAAAIREATSNSVMQAKAAEIGERIRAEDGLNQTVKAVKEFISAASA